MRKLLSLIVLSASVGCGAVDEPPLGGPYGGTTNATDPNGGNNGNNGTDSGTDSGTVQMGQDSGTQHQDSGTMPPPKDSGTLPPMNSGGTTTPTWSQIFTSYLASGTSGKCESCHSEGSSASSLYNWLEGKGYISGASSKLVNTSDSILSWYGGDMPPSGPTSDATAVSEMNAWAAAGAANN